jgi:DNA-binding response OmpR family regulator
MLNFSPQQQRILVLDGDPAILCLVSDTLDRAGFEVFTAASGQQALEVIARRGLPHLAIIDINTPGMDGFEFCQAVHQFADLPVIILTAVDEEETVIRGIEHCAEDYVTKPFNPRELVARVQRVLRRVGDFAYTLDPVTQADFLLRRLWPLEEVFEDTLRVHIHRLRRKIEPTPREPLYTVTERGVGYRFEDQSRTLGPM